jgi:hypothetical protein
MPPPTAARVREHSPSDANRQIERETQGFVALYADATAEEIAGRLAELDREWDIERTLQTNFAIVSGIGLVLAAMKDKRLALLSGLAARFMLQHSVQGWCPPLPVFRRLGVRTAAEISKERAALQALASRFATTASMDAPPGERARTALRAAR